MTDSSIMKKILTVTIFLVVTSGTLLAQNDFGVNVGVALPVNQFGKSDGELGSGGAEAGLNLSLVHRYHILADHLSWRSGLGLTINSVSEMRISSFERLFDSESNDRASDYFIVPLETGLETSMPFSDNVIMNISVGLSYTYLQLSTWEVDASKRVEFDPAFEFGYNAGLEFELYKHFLLGVRYYDLGDYQIDTSAFGFPNVEESQFTLNQRVRQVTISLGYRF